MYLCKKKSEGEVLLAALTSYLARGDALGTDLTAVRLSVSPQDTAPSEDPARAEGHCRREKVDAILSVSTTFGKFSSGQ